MLHKTNTNINSNSTPYRPNSATIKQSIISKYSKSPYNVTKFISSGNPNENKFENNYFKSLNQSLKKSIPQVNPNQKPNHYPNLNFKPPDIVYDESLRTKIKVNNVHNELFSLRSEHVRQENEMSKKNRIIEELFGPRESLLEPDARFKIKELKKKYRELLKEHNEAIFENENLKKNIKLSQNEEHKIQAEAYLEELNKLKILFEKQVMKNIENEYVILLISRKANNSIYNKGLASNKKDKDYDKYDNIHTDSNIKEHDNDWKEGKESKETSVRFQDLKRLQDLNYDLIKENKEVTEKIFSQNDLINKLNKTVHDKYQIIKKLKKDLKLLEDKKTEQPLTITEEIDKTVKTDKKEVSNTTNKQKENIVNIPAKTNIFSNLSIYNEDFSIEGIKLKTSFNQTVHKFESFTIENVKPGTSSSNVINTSPNKTNILMSSYNNDLSYYKDLVDLKDRRIKQLEQLNSQLLKNSNDDQQNMLNGSKGSEKSIKLLVNGEPPKNSFFVTEELNSNTIMKKSSRFNNQNSITLNKINEKPEFNPEIFVQEPPIIHEYKEKQDDPFNILKQYLKSGSINAKDKDKNNIIDKEKENNEKLNKDKNIKNIEIKKDLSVSVYYDKEKFISNKEKEKEKSKDNNRVRYSYSRSINKTQTINDKQNNNDESLEMKSQYLNSSQHLKSRKDTEIDVAQTDNEYPEDELNEFTYIFIKCLEAFQLSNEDIVKKIVIHNDSDNKINAISNKFIDLLSLRKINDQSKLIRFVKYMLQYSNNDINSLYEKFIALFESIVIYDEDTIRILNSKLFEIYGDSIEELSSEFSSYDYDKDNVVNFEVLRKVLEKIDRKVDDEEMEYLIFLLKHKSEISLGFDDLNYKNFLKCLQVQFDEKERILKEKAEAKRIEDEKIRKAFEEKQELEDKKKKSLEAKAKADAKRIEEEERRRKLIEDKLESEAKKIEAEENRKRSLELKAEAEAKRIEEDKRRKSLEAKVEAKRIEDEKRKRSLEALTEGKRLEDDKRKLSLEGRNKPRKVSVKNNYNGDDEFDYNEEDMDNIRDIPIEKSSVRGDKANDYSRKASTYSKLEADGPEIEITKEQFSQRVDVILLKIADFLISKKSTVKQLLHSKIYYHEVKDKDFYEAVLLKDFLDILSISGIKLDLTDIYCIFTKLKFSDEYETIDLQKLIDEMQNFGVFEAQENASPIKGNKSQPKENISHNQEEFEIVENTEEYKGNPKDNQGNNKLETDPNDSTLTINSLCSLLYQITLDLEKPINEILDPICENKVINNEEIQIITQKDFLLFLNVFSNEEDGVNKYISFSDECLNEIGFQQEENSDLINIGVLTSIYLNHINVQ